MLHANCSAQVDVGRSRRCRFWVAPERKQVDPPPARLSLDPRTPFFFWHLCLWTHWPSQARNRFSQWQQAIPSPPALGMGIQLSGASRDAAHAFPFGVFSFWCLGLRGAKCSTQEMAASKPGDRRPSLFGPVFCPTSQLIKGSGATGGGGPKRA